VAVKRHDYLPFGEELFAGIGGRTVTQGYTGDGVRQQFTAKEQDNETSLDYFINRYYSSTQGRFTTADPIPMTSQRPSDPQRLNLYAYVRGNPLVNVDPNGLDLYATGSEAQRYVDDLEKATGLKLKRDSKTGKISIVSEGKKLSKEAQRIKTIIGDTNNTVRIEAIRDTAGTSQVVVGLFEGGGRQTLDYADIDKFGKQKGGSTSGSIVIHETTEAYEGLTNPQSLAATSLFQQLKAAHSTAIEYENSYRRAKGLGERIDSNQITMTQGNQTLVVIDFTTHKERVVVDNDTQQIKSVEVIKKQ
jgi:RHS repeat-associated protein